MRNSRETELGLREIVSRIWRARWMILAFQVIVVAVVAFVILFCPRKYRSEVKLFLKVGRETVGLDPTATAGGERIGVTRSGRDDEIISAMDTLKSRGIIGRAVERVDPQVVLGNKTVGDGFFEKGNAFTDLAFNTLGWFVEQVRSLDPISPSERATIKVERNIRVWAERVCVHGLWP